MGDVAMSVPVIRAFLEQHSDVKITVVTRERFKPIFQNIEGVSVFGAQLKEKHKGVFGLFRLAKELRALNFDAIADLHNVLRTKILKLFLIDKKVVQLDKARAEKRALICGRSFHQLKTTPQRYADVFKNLGFKVDLSNPTFPPPAELDSELKRFISNAKLKTIGIAPFAAHKSKIYPLDKMKQVVAELSKQHNIVLFGGGTEEIEVLNTMTTGYDTVVSVAGKLNFEKELKLISNLDVMLSMDSGNGHLAAMLGKRVITIWGVTHPYTGFAPFNQSSDNALLADRTQFPLIPTSVYGNNYPEGYDMAAGSISPSTVVEKVKSVL
ncbi:ADP-heptose--LPS heptosyltransferase RfaF [Winogradskyella aurantia]|uniref:ADP-heptose--LPS heptosyltransferase RfaF n=2 Tax=Winogradskyella aurantia TaxID=1915063 RepID=A0A265V0R8_9FLAO|nr:ADP-heptose--LPS heptosyltransferase RfaF [Winogradskyella aurantia]